MRHLYVLTLILFTSISHVFSQQQTNFWHFSQNCGLDFNSGSPVALTNSAVNTNEGTASISDASGNLLFYTNGVDVWNRNNLIMPNGTGLFGDVSTTQVMVVPAPSDTNHYFIFTIGLEGGNLYFSEVNMTLDGGLGDVTVKNTLLKNDVTEKICAVYHCNNHDIWVMTHAWNSNEFDRFL